MSMDKKRAAALAGVMYYLQQEADEREDESVRMGMRRRRSGWSTYGRNAVARGRLMVQGRRIRRALISRSLQLSTRKNSKTLG